jgi:pyrimidine-nucleoside phosphorylase
VRAMLIGAGREKLGDKIDHAVGLTVHRKLGERVSKGEPLVTLQYNSASRLHESEKLVAEAYEIQDSPPAAQGLVPEPANPAGKFRALFGIDGVAFPRHI